MQLSVKRTRTQLMPNISDHNVANHRTVAISAGPIPHATAYFNTAKNAVYSRYTTSDWEASNKTNFSQADVERNFAERLRSEVFRTVKAADHVTRTRQQSNTKKLGNRVKDISFWKEELVKEISYMTDEIANLEEHRRLLEKALCDTCQPLSIAEACMTLREKRVGIDLVNDDVERCLTKEVESTKKCQNQMKRLLEQVHIQLRMNRAAQKACESDTRDKHHAQHLDDRMYQMRNSSSRIGFCPGIEDVDNTVSVPDTWMKFTQENLNRSQHEREMSERIRGSVDACIKACATEMWNNNNEVNNALNARVKQLGNTKDGLQSHLIQTNNEIRDLERSIDLLKKAIEDKEAPLKLAQTRLDDRSRRISVELCHDKAMTGLQKEVKEILDSMRVLKDKLRTAMQSLNRLQRTKMTLEGDISVKDVSLEIDLQGCIGLRKNMALDPTRGGNVFSMPLNAY